jgi:hypothetical protein
MITTTSAAVFIPEVWLNEVQAQYENMFIFGKKVRTINHKGKAGDTLHIPNISNLGDADDVVQNQDVVDTTVTETETQILINKWKSKSVMISDLAKVQSQYDLRSEYTKKLSYAIGRRMEIDVASLFAASDFSGINADGTAEATGGAAITLAGILKGQEILLGNDVPQTDLCLIIPPSARTTMLQIAAFTSVDYVNSKVITTGLMGQILGMDVYVSNNCPSYAVSSTKINAILLHKDAACIALQIAPRVQSEYVLKRLAYRVVADVAYGVKALRGTNALRLRLNTTA